MADELKILSGRAHPQLAQKIAEYRHIPLGHCSLASFADGECNVSIEENVRGTDCFIVQPTCPPVNDNLMELLTITDALRRASARRITAVLSYYGYARQDRKVEPRVPITARLVADLITAAGVNRVLAIDLHTGQIQGFFNIPVDNLFATPVLLPYFQERARGGELVIISPDPGGVERARAFAKRLDANIAIADKRRPHANESVVMHIVGDVKGKQSLIVDDIVDTAGTLAGVSEALKDAGATHIYACATHGLLSGDAGQRIMASPIEELVVTDSIAIPKEKVFPKLKILSVAELLGEAILRIHNETSVSNLFV